MHTRAAIIIFGICFCASCRHNHEKKYVDYEALRDSVEKGTEPFDPGFMRFCHVSLVFRIDDDEISDSLVTVKGGNNVPMKKTVSGKFPAMKTGGQFEVIFKDSLGNEVYRYRMQSPLYHRIERGPRKGVVKVRSGWFEVSVPDDSTIRKIVLKERGLVKHETDFKFQPVDCFGNL